MNLSGQPCAHVNMEEMGLYNIGFVIPLYVPVVLMGSALQAVYIGGAPNML